jgi:hypothetical protein
VSGSPSARVIAAADAVVDALLAVDVAGMDDPEAAAHVLAVERLGARIDGLRLRTVRALERHGVWAVEAAATPAAWLRHRTGTSAADAGRQVRLARSLASMPLADEALCAGEISMRAVHLLARCATPRTRALYGEHEAMLVDQARQLSADQLEKVVEYWLALADPDGREPSGDAERDSVHLSRAGNGRWSLRGDLCDEIGAEIAALLQEMCDQLFRRDHRLTEVDPDDPVVRRPPSNRRAEALHELIRQGGAAPTNAGRRRPSISVLADAASLGASGHASQPVHETIDGTVIPLRLLRLWSCDAELLRVVLGASGEPLDVGRSERHPTGAQRRALEARDRGCAVPGCDRPPAWCDAHHVVEWGAGGPTDIDNLVLLCRHHHRRIHHGRLVVRMVDRRPAFFLASGRRLDERRREPPPHPLAS